LEDAGRTAATAHAWGLSVIHLDHARYLTYLEQGKPGRHDGLLCLFSHPTVYI
jgi:hypothetical protein